MIYFFFVFWKGLGLCALNLIGFMEACIPHFYNGMKDCMDRLEFNNKLVLSIVGHSMLMSCFLLSLNLFFFYL